MEHAFNRLLPQVVPIEIYYVALYFVAGVEPPTPAFSERLFPVFPTTSMVVAGLPNTGKYAQDRPIVGDLRGWLEASIKRGMNRIHN